MKENITKNNISYELEFKVYEYGYGYKICKMTFASYDKANRKRKLALYCMEKGIGSKFLYKYIYLDGVLEEVFDIIEVTRKVIRS